jgi:hypothetical protein
MLEKKMSELDLYMKQGHIAWIDEPLKGFYDIVRREPFDFTTGEESTAIFTTVASGSSSGFQPIDELEPDNKPLHLYQVLWGVADCGEIKYYIKIPTGQNRFGIDEDKEIGFINAEKSPYFAPNPLYQFYLINEWYPSVNCVNNSPVTITPKVWFRGMKYDISPVVNATIRSALEAGKHAHRRIYFGGVKNTP